MTKKLCLSFALALAWIPARANSNTLTHATIYRVNLSNTATAFTPLLLPSIKCWLDSSNSASVTLSGSHVTQITDLTTNGDNGTQVTVSSQPVYVTAAQNGLNVVSFASPNYVFNMANNPLNQASNFSLAFLVKTPTGSVTGYYYQVLNNGTNQFETLFYQNTTYLEIAGNASNLSNPLITTEGFGALSVSTWYMIFITYDHTQSTANNRLRVYINNVDVTHIYDAAGTGPTNSSNSEQIGYPASGSWVGLQGEFIITDAAFTLSDRSNLYTYWKSKWGL